MSNDKSTAYSKYVPEWERPVITALMKALLAEGYLLDVHDGEERVSPRTDKLTEIRPTLGGTGEDTLRVYRPREGGNPEYLGYWYLIYHNGSENDPMVVISDYSWKDGSDYKEVADRIYADLGKKYDQ